MSKRILSLVLAMVMVLGTFGTLAFAETANERVNKLIEMDLVKGDEKGDYRLSDTIRRDEVAAMVVRSMDLESVANAMVNVPTKFVDVVAGQWNNGYVSVAEGRGITKGTGPNTFDPARSITYQEVAAMLVRVFGVDAEEEATYSWPASYVAKAHELGILEDVSIANMGEMAVREKVFEMVYNTILKTNRYIASTVEGIVVENYRTENIGKDEIIVHVMKDQVQRTGVGVKYREEGDEFKVTIDKELRAKGLDVETLLGKVVTVSFDKDDKVVNIEKLTGYNYVEGKVNEVTGKDIKVAGKWYTIGKEETRSTVVDERLYQVYLNNEDLHYNKFAYLADWDDDVATANTWGTEGEYARLTVRNGKVLFIDAFDFEDVAPVAKDITDKDIVAYYDDLKDGAIETIEIDEDAFVINFEEKEMKLGSNEDIKANDVIHFFEDYKGNLTVIVRPEADNKVEGVYNESNAARANLEHDINVMVDRIDYPATIRDDNRTLVYSTYFSEYDFLTLSENYDADLADFEKKDVVVLLDMFGYVQLIGSETIDGSFYAIIRDNFNYDFNLLKADNAKFADSWYDTDARKTTFKVGGEAIRGTKEQQLDEFQVGDLVKVVADEDLITLLDDVTGASQRLYKLNTNVIDFAPANETKVLGENYFYVSKNYILFVNGEEAVTMKQFADNYAITEDTEAYIISSVRDEDVAQVIVVTGANEKDTNKYDTFVARVTRVRPTGANYYLSLRTADDKTSTRLVAGNKDLVADNTIGEDDIVKVKVVRSEDNDGKIVEITELIDADELVFKVIDFGTDRTKTRNERYIVLEDEFGVSTTLWISSSADVFGTYAKGRYVALKDTIDGVTAIDAYNIIDLLYVKAKTTPLADITEYEYAPVETETNVEKVQKMIDELPITIADDEELAQAEALVAKAIEAFNKLTVVEAAEIVDTNLVNAQNAIDTYKGNLEADVKAEAVDEINLADSRLELKAALVKHAELLELDLENATYVANEAAMLQLLLDLAPYADATEVKTAFEGVIALEEAEANAAALEEVHYTIASWGNLTNALTLDETNVTEITDKVTAINTAIEGLVMLIVDFTPIGDVQAGSITETNVLADADAVKAVLPTTVEVELADGTKVDLEVNDWTDSDSYNAGLEGSYTFTANVNVPAEYDLVSIVISVEVVVAL